MMVATQSVLPKRRPHQATFIRRTRQERIAFWLILVCFVGLSGWYSMATPPFETPDEVYHYAFVRHLAAGNPLPVQQAGAEAPWEQEGSQAPLYYLVAGWLTRAIDQSDFPALSVRNPRANIGDPLFPGNKNFMLYSAAAYPLVGANLALHIGRWISLVLGCLTLWFTYRTAKLAFVPPPTASTIAQGDETTQWSLRSWLPLIVTAWTAAIPQFAFISAACSNDSMIIATSAATLYWLAQLVVTSQTRPIKLWEWAGLGVLLGLAALSKLQGLGLIGLAGCAILVMAWQQRAWRLLLTTALAVGLPLALVAGWWYVRNVILYGDLFGISYLLVNNGQRTESVTWAALPGELRGLRYSFWGLFGWFNMLLPTWIYGILDGLSILGLLGLVGQALRGQRLLAPTARLVRWLVGLWCILALLLLAYWIYRATGSQGRLLFNALGALVILLVWGIAWWLNYLPPRWQLPCWLAPPLLLVGSSLFALTVSYPAAYRASPTVIALPSTAQPVEMRYRKAGTTDELRVVGLETPTDRFQPGEWVPITLYLTAPQPVHQDYQLFIQLLDEQNQEVGNLTSHPGWGRNPTRLWQPGALYRDSYRVLISRPIDNHAPLLAKVYVGFIDPATERSGRFPISAYNSAGEPVAEPFLATVAIAPLTTPQPTAAMQTNGAQFGHVIQLAAEAAPAQLSLQAGATFTVTLLWDALAQPATDYTAFVHLLDAQGQRVSGFDQAPAPRFPTQFWRQGDRIVSTFALPLPAAAGDYQLWAGLYETQSGGALRLPITAAAEQITGDGQVQLGRVTIIP